MTLTRRNLIGSTLAAGAALAMGRRVRADNQRDLERRLEEVEATPVLRAELSRRR